MEDFLKKLLVLIALFLVTGVASNKVELHTVISGDTLYDIARANHTTIEKICRMNKLKKEDILRIGMVLKMPMQDRGRQEEVLAGLPKVPQVPTVIQLAKVKSSVNKSTKKIVKHRRIHKSIIRIAEKKLGSRYVWGATGKKNTFDCSGFTSYVYKKYGINIPRTSRNQSKYGKYVKRDNLKKGDLIFFDTSKKHKGYVNHVGIYLGDNRFIHASSAKKRVVVSKLSKFYAQRYKGARRPS